MCKTSTLTLVAAAVAALVCATVAHAWLLSPETPAGDVAGRSSPMVTVVQDGSGKARSAPVEIAGRAARQATVDPSGPDDGGVPPVFGPRSLPSRLHGLLWHHASLDAGTAGVMDRFITVAADTASITCDQAWARPTAGAATTAAAWFTLTNNGPPDQLVGASSPIAASAGVHETIDDNGVMKMRPVASIALAPGKQVAFRPGGYHVMLTGLKAPLKAGDSFPLTLTFAHAQPITVMVKVTAGGAGMGPGTGPGMGPRMGNGSMGGMPGMH